MRTILFLAFVLFTNSLTPLFAFQKNGEEFVVVLDAGHGGKDPGRPTRYGYKEKNIALKLALKVGAMLEKHKDIKVIYTRKTDVFLELRERASIANKADADLFVSIHCNAHESQAHGTETYVLATRGDDKNFEIAKKENEVILLESNYEKHYEGFDPNSPQSLIGLSIIQEEYLDQSILLARTIEDKFKHDLKRKSRGVKQAGFWVLHNTYMPSVLIETGFITYKKEGDYLNSNKGQNEMAKAISDAILSYKSKLDKNVGDHVFDEEDFSIDEVISNKEKDVYTNIVFKVQIAASSRKLEPKPYNFKGLQGISRLKENGLYKYYYGYTSDLDQAKKLLAEAKAKGYDSCFLVAYKNDKRIKLSEALKTDAN